MLLEDHASCLLQRGAPAKAFPCIIIDLTVGTRDVAVILAAPGYHFPNALFPDVQVECAVGFAQRYVEHVPLSMVA